MKLERKFVKCETVCKSVKQVKLKKCGTKQAKLECNFKNNFTKLTSIIVILHNHHHHCHSYTAENSKLCNSGDVSKNEVLKNILDLAFLFQ